MTMTSDWFRLPEAGSGTATDPPRPDLFGHDVDRWSGTKQHPGGAPKWVVRVYADESVLSALANEPQAKRLSDLPVQALNQMLGQDRDAEGWRRGFNVEGGQ